MSASFERLEDRRLLAATVHQTGGTLNIVGDNSADNIRVEGEGPGSVLVYADQDGDGDLELLGTFEDVVNVRINSRGRNDIVSFDRLDISGDLIVQTGQGDDCVIVSDSDIQDDLSFGTGVGDDLVVLQNSVSVGDQARIQTGRGNDAMSIDVTTFNGVVNLHLGSGHDVLILDEDNTVFSAGGTLDGSAGQDLLLGDDAVALELALSGAGVTVQNFEAVDDVGNVDLTELEARFADCLAQSQDFG